MPESPPIDPYVGVPSAAGTVASVGTEPLPKWLDPEHTGIALYDRKDVRNLAVQILLQVVKAVAPKNPFAILIVENEQEIEDFIDKGAK